MKLSIIIPSYNSSETILKTIRSIYSSNNITRYDFEIILVDDCSTDNSKWLVKNNFPTTKIIELSKNNGAAKARNEGIKNANGNYLLFIDSDMWFNLSSVETLVKSVEKETDIIFPKICYENGQVMYPLLDIEKKYPHISGCFLIKKESLNMLDDLFDEKYQTYLEDYDFFIRCKLSGLKAKYAKEARIIHKNKVSHNDYSKRYYLEIRNTIYGIKKIGKKAKKSGLYNPFTYSSLFKAFLCGLFNFAWFNWYGYERDKKNISLGMLMKNKNKITKKRLKLITLFFKALKDGQTLKTKKAL